MAQMCIKTKRTKMAKLCLGKLKNAKALRSISNSVRYGDEKNSLAHIALHLGMLEEAKQIWSENKLFSDLNCFYQAAGKWDQALDIASKKDRPSLPKTYFNFAKSLEESGDQEGAIAAYEKSHASK